MQGPQMAEVAMATMMLYYQHNIQHSRQRTLEHPSSGGGNGRNEEEVLLRLP
jgi:hypothetical protein